MTHPHPDPLRSHLPSEPTDAQIISALEWSLEWMRKHNVDGLSPFKDYPPVKETIAGMWSAMVAALPAALASAPQGRDASDDDWEERGAAQELRDAVIEACIEAMPSTAENPNEDSYQRGRFDGIMEYHRKLRALKSLPASDAWRPIDSAPRDRTVEAKNENGDLFQVWWDDAAFKGFPVPGGIMCVPRLTHWRERLAPPSPSLQKPQTSP